VVNPMSRGHQTDPQLPAGPADCGVFVDDEVRAPCGRWRDPTCLIRFPAGAATSGCLLGFFLVSDSISHSLDCVGLAV